MDHNHLKTQGALNDTRGLMKLSDWEPNFCRCWREGYRWEFFRKDLFSGITVGLVAAPLAMAFAIASGVSPEQGLYTGILAGFLISFLGGSRYQIGGPTGAFVIIIYDIMNRFGYEGLVIIMMMAGVLLLIAALMRLGDGIRYIPYPLITGFTSGIAVLIFSSQIKDFLGLSIPAFPGDFLGQWHAIFLALPSFDWVTTLFSCGILGLMMVIKRKMPLIPWAFVGVTVGTLLSLGMELPLETLQTRFGKISGDLPRLHTLQWPSSWGLFLQYLPSAITVAFLAGVESLLSAVVADGMSGKRHHPHAELLAQGIANMGSALFGGIPATGAIARTAINVKTGAATPVSGMIHALTLLLITVVLAPIVGHIPLAALSAILMLVVWNMSEKEHFYHLFSAPRSDVVILLTTFLLTIVVDLTVAVGVGMVMAAFTFMQKMTKVSKVVHCREEMLITYPKEIEVYEIQGPLFFGVVSSLRTILSEVESSPKVFILRLRSTTLLDASGMHALEMCYTECIRSGSLFLLTEVEARFLKKLTRFGLIDKIGKEQIFSHFQDAVDFATSLLSKNRTHHD